jgi:radical SAM superfamily enzyme YgiQ (UPF0313 family)
MARAVLISTYDLGHQPFGLASPAAWLKREGLEVECVDLARQKFDEQVVERADLIAFHLPMHTATRLAAPVIRKIRRLNPSLRICAYGLYAPLNDVWLRSLGVDDVLGVEFEAELSALAGRVASNGLHPAAPAPREHHRAPGRRLPKLQFITPDRSSLPPLNRYASLQAPDGTRRVIGYTEASRGCRHVCRHCPVVPVYDGEFRVVQSEVVLADIRAQVAAGAEHITFGDPDFFNGPTHAMRIVQKMHEEFPAVTYDVTIKVEHLLKQASLLPLLAGTGCLFVTSAVESIDDRVLALLDKGHTRRDFEEAVALCRDAGVTIIPTFVAFHPWITLDDYCELLDEIVRLQLVDRVAPIQLAIRLLVPSGSRLLELPEMQQWTGNFDANTLTYHWAHPDPRVDELQTAVAALVGRKLTSHRRELFDAIRMLAYERAERPVPRRLDPGAGAPVPQVDEPWYCCAEPNPEQLTLV